MVYVLILLRLIHITAGVLWAGAAIAYFFFVEPAVKGLGPARPKFMQDLIDKLHYPLFMNTVSLLTILAGAALFWHASGGLQPAWITSGPGLGFTIGSITAIVVFGIGFFMIRPRAERLGALGRAIASAGGPPTIEQTVSLVTMATARYWLV